MHTNNLKQCRCVEDKNRTSLNDRNFKSEGKIGKLVQNVNKMDTARQINENLGRRNGTCSCTKTLFIGLSTETQGHSRVAKQ